MRNIAKVATAACLGDSGIHATIFDPSIGDACDPLTIF
jgi:hypothetical protein